MIPVNTFGKTMRKLLKKVTCLALATVFLVGCVKDDGTLNKETVGGLSGAVAGAWIGSNTGKGKGNIAAIAVGTLLGAAIGSDFGRSLDKADMKYYNQTGQTALEYNRTGATSTWKNPDSGASGTFTPKKTFERKGNYCREFTQTIKIGGKSESGYGTACRQPDGSWKIVN